MELIKPGTVIDFMRLRKLVFPFSLGLALLSAVSVFFPGPNYGIDFKGGTEVQLRFPKGMQARDLRQSVEELGYVRPDVVSVEGAQNEFIVRVQEVNALSPAKVRAMKSRLKPFLKPLTLRAFRASPGGDKLSLQLSGDIEPDALKAALLQAGARVRAVNRFGKVETNRFEAQLVGVADVLTRKLQDKLGDAAPEPPRRVEWIGPRAGEQLRDAAIKALLWAIAFIMVYVALRFDLRYAPGGVLAMLHDAMITLGIFVLLRKQVNLTTVAALLTILGYSINDTIVVYDRIRENMARLRGKSLYELINLSTSQMLSRTIVTSGTTLLSVSAFFIWGTSVIRDIAFALFIGILIGTYSSIYIAAPVTEWMDRRFFRRNAKAAPARG
ncbi:MAG: protein translocase subunit SecF [Polyangiales bacterium]